MFCTRLANGGLFPTGDPIVPFVISPRFECLNKRTHTHTHTHTHTQTCKHRQTGSSHCSSFVYTLTFSQHLSYVLYTFGKRGPFSSWGPYCSFCYKSPVWMPKQTHTHNKLDNKAVQGIQVPGYPTETGSIFVLPLSHKRLLTILTENWIHTKGSLRFFLNKKCVVNGDATSLLYIEMLLI